MNFICRYGVLQTSLLRFFVNGPMATVPEAIVQVNFVWNIATYISMCYFLMLFLYNYESLLNWAREEGKLRVYFFFCDV